MKMKKLNLLAVLVTAGAMVFATGSTFAMNAQDAPVAQATPDAATHTWPIEQLIPLSVREAWALGGKTEQGFFEIVRQLTEVSAQKRGVSLPDNKDAGAKAGEWIKKEAKRDPDQLLYVVVDRAVQYSARVGTQK